MTEQAKDEQCEQCSERAIYTVWGSKENHKFCLVHYYKWCASRRKSDVDDKA